MTEGGSRCHLRGTPVLCWQGPCQRRAAPTPPPQGRPATPPKGAWGVRPGRAVRPSPGWHHSAWHFPNVRDRGKPLPTPRTSMNIFSSSPWKQSVKHKWSDSLMNTGRAIEKDTKISSVVTCGFSGFRLYFPKLSTTYTQSFPSFKKKKSSVLG